MDHLETIISTLDGAERREFRYFIQRNKRKNDRKDLAVFDRFCQVGRKLGMDEVEALGFPSSNAYHSTRKRLYAHLSDFAVLKSQLEDGTDSSRVSGLIQISRHLFDRGLIDLAWTLLAKAEALAKRKGLYGELNSLHLVQAEHAGSRPGFDLLDLMRRHESNRERVATEEALLLKRAEVEHRIARARQSGQEVDLVNIFQGIMHGASDRSSITNSPRSLYLILRSMRQSMIHSREYAVFANMTNSLYNSLGDRSQHLYNAEILYMIAHAEYRNKQFGKAHFTLDRSADEVEQCSRTEQKRLTSKLRILRAANGLLLGHLKESILALEELLAGPTDARMKANVTVNLSTYHFYAGQYGESLKVLSTLDHSDRWYEERMGLEWCFKQGLIGLLAIHEKGDVDLFESRRRSIQRRFADLLSRPQYAKAKAFLDIVVRYDRHYEKLDMKELEAKIEVDWEWLPKEEEDLQAMMFYAWLKSKIVGESCYSVLLDLMV